MSFEQPFYVSLDCYNLKLSRICKKDISIGSTFGHFTAIINFCLFNRQFPRLEAFLLFQLAAGATFSCALATQGGGEQKLAAVRLLRYRSHIFSQKGNSIKNYILRPLVKR